MGRFIRLALGVLPVVAVIAAISASAAQADPNVYLTINNDTPYNLKVFGTNSYCWYPGNLDADAPKIDARTEKRVQIEAKNSGSCYQAGKTQDLDIGFQQAGGTFPNPFKSALTASDAFPFAINEGWWDIKVYNNQPADFRGVPKGWFPINPDHSGNQDGQSRGPFCVTANRLYGTELKIVIRSLAQDYRENCTPRATAAALRVKPARPPSGLRPARVKGGPEAGPAKVVYDLFQLADAACSMTHPLQPWGISPCDSVGKTDAWDLHNVKGVVREAKASTDPRVITDTQESSPDVFDNLKGKGELVGKWSYEYTKGDETSTGTERGFKVKEGIEWAKKFTLPIIGEFEQKLSIDVEHSFIDTTEQKQSTEKKVGKEVEVHVEPHTKTWFYIKQKQASLLFNFQADLTAGEPNLAQPLMTPMTRVLGISAARRQPCIGYLAGAGGNSLMGLAAYARSQGLSPETVGLPADQRAFLEAAPGFTVSSADKCPGFPTGFPASFSFKGTAAYQGKAAGPTGEGGFAPKLPNIEACAYSEEASPTKVPPAQDHPGGSCQSGFEPPSGNATGGVVLAKQFGVGAVVRSSGTRDDLVIADCTSADYSAAGIGDDIVQGDRKCDRPTRMVAGAGDDILNAGGGPATLIGGTGDDTLNGGPGKDTLIDTRGKQIALFAGPGNDTLISSGKARGGMLGGRGNDTLIMRGRGPVIMAGGPGSNTYELLDGASARNVAQLPGRGIDKVVTDHSVTAPPNIESVRAIGRRSLTLRASQAGVTLTGSRGNDRLIGGPDGSLNGGAGNNTLVLSAFGFTRARGGSGRNRFVIRSQRAPNPALYNGMRLSNMPIAEKSADVIENLHRGDRVVLSTSSFGSALGRLRRHMRVTIGRRPRGRAPQFVFTRSRGLLQFAPNGEAAPSQVVAILKGYRRLPRWAIQITK